MLFERYREVIPDWNAFQESIQSRDPTTIRVRTGRISSPALMVRLVNQGFLVEEIEGVPSFIRVLDGPFNVADTIEHWLGLFYVQQVSTGLAALALQPNPGEHILDLCAAPGGKTTQIADLMQGRGCLVAVDRNEGRLQALLGNLYRLAHTNVMVVSGDGLRLPETVVFDGVLVDAPCSGEGTLRRKSTRRVKESVKFRKSVPRRQEALLRKAIALTRPGGVVVYSTCTFAPEENEEVIDAVLKDGSVYLEKIDLQVPHDSGLTSFEGKSFDPSLEKTCRIYPHHLNSGGFFMARLRHRGTGTQTSASKGLAWDSASILFPGEKKPLDHATEVTKNGIERMRTHVTAGIDLDSDFQWMLRGKDLWLHNCCDWPSSDWFEGDKCRVLSVGLRAMSPVFRDEMRPTNDVLRFLENYVSSVSYRPDAIEWNKLLERENIPVSISDSGFIALKWKGHVLGRGLVHKGTLRAEIPGVRGRWLKKVFAISESSETGNSD